MPLTLTLILAATVTTSPQLECAEKYVSRMDASAVDAVREMQGLDEFIVSTEKDAISVGIAKSCSKDGRLELNSLGIRYPENQLEVLAQAAFLVLKHGGDYYAFVDYVATEYARWEINSDVQPAMQNPACANEFAVLGSRIQVWTPGQLMYRLHTVGVCHGDRTFWLFQVGIGWRRLDPYERADICTTMNLQNSDVAQYCTE